MSLSPLTIIPAGAGSGKTYTIQTRLAEWVRDRKVAPEKIVAVTFTEAAASELRDRIRAELVGQGRLEDALSLDQAYISTIHSFGLRVLTEFALDAGLNPQPRLLTEDEQGVLIRLALAATDKAEPIMGDLYRYGYSWDFMTQKGPEDKFREQVLEVIRRLRTLGPTANDSRLIEQMKTLIREQYGATGDAKTLTASLKAAVANLLSAYPESLGSYCNDAGVVKAVDANHKLLRRVHNTDILNDNWSVWQSLRGLRTGTSKNPLPDDYDALVEEVKARAEEGLLLHPGPLADATLHGKALFGAAQDSLSRFAQGKADRGLVDYTDMLALALEMLVREPKVLAALRDQVDCLVIDEFQDTNPLQFALLWCLHRAGVPTMVVGDLKQAIMGFQDADSRLLAELQAQKSDAVSPLACNWRSHPGLMAWINELGDGLFGPAYTRLKPKADFPSSLSHLELIEFTKSSNNGYKTEHTVARIKALLDDPASMVWDKHNKKSRQIRGGDIAIICPTNTRLKTYAKALRQLGVRARIDAEGWFDSRIVQIAYHVLCYVADPQDRHAALYLATTELGSETLQSALGTMIDGQEPTQEVLDRLKPLRSSCADQMPVTLLAQVVDVLDLYGVVARWPEGEQARANLLRLEAEAREFVAANRDAQAASGFYGSDLKTFLAWLKARAEREDAQPEPRVLDEDAVQLMTWHRAKGREWPVVAVCATESEIKCILPDVQINYKDFSDLDKILDNARLDFYPKFDAPEKTEIFRDLLWPEAVDSARRLLYVALTRAREKIILEWPAHLDNGRARKSFTFWEQLVEDTGMTLDGNQLSLGGKSFDCRVTQVGKEQNPLFEEDDVVVEQTHPEFGRHAIEAKSLPGRLTPEAVQPSLLEVEVEISAESLVMDSYAGDLTLEFNCLANVRGNILHRCYEIMDGQRDIGIIQRAAGFSFNQEQFDDLNERVKAFNALLDKHFQPVSKQHEVPILGLNDQGSVIAGFIDLLVETAEGYWIIDHKSDQVDDLVARFKEHLPQLICYRDALQTIDPSKPVLGVGINWVSYGKVFLLPN